MKTTRKPVQFRIAKRKSEIQSRRPDRPDRPEGGAGLRRLALRRQEGPAGLRPSPGQEGTAAAPCPDRRRVPPLLRHRGSGRGRAARPDAAAAVLHGRPGLRTVQDRGGRRGPGELQDLRQPGQGQQGSLRPVRQELRHGPTDAHRRPSAQPLAVPDPKRATKFSTRRVEQIVKKYAEEAGVRATPHTFRHQAITWLTRHSGMADAELQLITGHARRETLAVYQHVALDGELEAKYQGAMKEAGL